jgi:hypothetical protein
MSFTPDYGIDSQEYLEAQQWYREHQPIIRGPRPDIFAQTLIFQKGLQATADDLNGTVNDIYDQIINQYELYENPYPYDQARLVSDVKKAVDTIVELLVPYFPNVPPGWIKTWIRAFVIFPRDLLPLNVPYYDQSRPQSLQYGPNHQTQPANRRIDPPTAAGLESVSLPGLNIQNASTYGKADRPYEPSSSGTRPELSKCEFVLISVKPSSEGNDLSSNLNELGRIPASSCRIQDPELWRNFPGAYSLAIFKSAFDLQLAKTREDDRRLLLDYGVLTYIANRSLPLDHTRIETQDNFENALYSMDYDREDTEFRFGFFRLDDDDLVSAILGTPPAETQQLSRKTLRSNKKSPSQYPPIKSSLEYGRSLSKDINPPSSNKPAQGSRQPGVPKQPGIISGPSQKLPSRSPRPLSPEGVATHVFIENTDRQERVRALRLKFPIGRRPTVPVAEKALVDCEGDIDNAFSRLTAGPTSRRLNTSSAVTVFEPGRRLPPGRQQYPTSNQIRRKPVPAPISTAPSRKSNPSGLASPAKYLPQIRESTSSIPTTRKVKLPRPKKAIENDLDKQAPIRPGAKTSINKPPLSSRVVSSLKTSLSKGINELLSPPPHNSSTGPILPQDPRRYDHVSKIRRKEIYRASGGSDVDLVEEVVPKPRTSSTERSIHYNRE